MPNDSDSSSTPASTSSPTPAPPAPPEWYYVLAGQQAGPISQLELENLIQGGAITRETLIWAAHMPDWKPAITEPLAASAFPDFGRNIYPNSSQAPPTVAGPVVRTNELISNVVPAGIVPRFFALLIDSVILTVIYGIFMAVSVFVFLVISKNLAPVFLFLWMTLMIAIFVLYFALQDCSSARGTIGKRALGLCIVDAQGNRLTRNRSLVRAAVKVLLSTSFFMVGCIVAIFTKKQQALHDLVAQTYVVRKAQ